MGRTTSQGNIANTETTTIDEFNIGLEEVDNGSIVLGQVRGGDDVEINITDGGIAREAFDFARDTNDFARDTNDTARLAIKASGSALDRALDFGDEALEFGRRALSDTLDFADAESARYLRAQTAVTERAFESNDRAVSQVRAEASASRTAIIDEASANRTALMRTFDGSFEAIKSGYGKAIGAVSDSVDKVTRAVTSTIETATNATRSETAQGFDTLIKYGAFAAAAIALALIMTR